MLFCPQTISVGVHGFKGSGVQGSILIPGLYLGCVFTRKASVLSGLIQYLKPNWQLFWKMNIFVENFWSLMPSLSLTLNVEPLAQTDHRHYVCEKYSLSLVGTTLELCHESHQGGPEPVNDCQYLSGFFFDPIQKRLVPVLYRETHNTRAVIAVDRFYLFYQFGDQ